MTSSRDAAPIPGEPRHSSRWRRGRLAWLAGVLAPERLRPDARLALRGILGLMPPLLLGRVLDLPGLDLVGLAAFLLTFGDVTGAEEPHQLGRLAAGSILGALALASGVVAGSNTASAIAGMFAWGAVAGLLGVWGNAGAAMGLPVAWAYLELGLTAPSHGLRPAIAMAALYGCGGLWAIILASTMTAIDPDRTLRQRAAECCALVASYLERALSADRPPAGDALSPETPVRQAIATARDLAVRTRRSRQASSTIDQELVLVIELADQLFSLGAALGDWLALSGTVDRDAHAVLVEAIHALPRAIARRAQPETLLCLIGRLERLIGEENAGEGGKLSGRVAATLATILRIAAGTAPAAAASVVGAAPVRDPARFIEPLRACLSWDSVVMRHALRFGVLAAAAVAVQRLWDPPFGYWIPLTVSVVLKPYAGTTLTRGAQRLSGTVAGVAFGLALSMLIGGWAAQATATAVLFFLLLAVLPINYGWAVFFLSAGIIPLEGMMTASLGWQAGLFRIVNTGIGGFLALAGSRLLWPMFEASALPVAAAETLRATAGYARCVLSRLSPPSLELARRRAGLADSNLQALFQQSVSDFRGEPDRFRFYLVALASLQRMLLSLNTLRVLGPERGLARVEERRFADCLVLELERLGGALDTGEPPARPDGLDEALHSLDGRPAGCADRASPQRRLTIILGRQALMLDAAVRRLLD